MRICIVTSAKLPPEEGIGNYVFGLSKELKRQGHQITIVTRGAWGGNKQETLDGINVIKVRFAPLYPIYMRLHGFFVNMLLKSMEDEFDLINIHSPLSPCVKTSLPIVATVHTPMLVDAEAIEAETTRTMFARLMAKNISFPLEQKIFGKSELITTVARSVADELRRYNIPSDKVYVVGNAIDKRLYTPMKEKHDSKYILYVGRLDYRKGLFDLLECGKQLIQKHPDYRIVITGKGILRNELEEKVVDFNLQDNIVFLGHVSRSELISLYQNAAIFVLPSHYEGLPTVLLEAMSCGLPVVATAVSGNVDVIVPGKNGLLIPPKNPEIMANSISTLIENKELRERLGAMARNTIEENYTWDIVAQKYVKLFQKVIEGPK